MMKYLRYRYETSYNCIPLYEMFSSLKWFHAVNSRDRLGQVLVQLSDVPLLSSGLEIDVRLRSGQLVLQHDETHQENAETFNDFFVLLLSNSTLLEKVSVIKIDVKEPTCCAPLLQEVQRFPPELLKTIWFNADVVSGPGGLCSPFLCLGNELVLILLDFAKLGCGLSLGWTTNSLITLSYSTEHTDQMLQLLLRLQAGREQREQSVPYLVTFPVRHSLVVDSAEAKAALHDLLKWCTSMKVADQCFLTFWRGRTEQIDDVTSILQEFPDATVDTD